MANKISFELQPTEGAAAANASEAAEPSTDLTKSIQTGADANPEAEAYTPVKKDAQFWYSFLAITVTTILSALDVTAVTVAMPSISHDLHSGSLYGWVLNSFFLTATVSNPLYGHMSDIFGRRWLYLSTVAFFALGSGICGGASSPAMLIAGRALQGIGWAGINMFAELILCDLLPQRERGVYMSLNLAVYGVGLCSGPLIAGGIVKHTTWRWIFWINLPLCGISMGLIFFFLHLRYDRKSTITSKLKRIDYVGNIIVMGSTIGVILGLVWGSSKFSWASYRIIVPIVIGGLGLALFGFYESTRFCREPTMPLRLLSNRTSLIGFILTFLHYMLLLWGTFFIPVYFLALKQASPLRTGIDFIPTAAFVLLGAVFGGTGITITGAYKILTIISQAFVVLGFGLFTLLHEHSSKAEWVIFQALWAFGTGSLIVTILPAIQVGLPEKDVAASMGVFSFFRSFGGIWGVSIATTVFDSRVNGLLHRLNNLPGGSDVAGALRDGGAYESATPAFLNTLAQMPRTLDAVLSIYDDALRLVWQVGLGFAGFAFLLTLLLKQMNLRTEIETDFGLETKDNKKS